MSLANTALAKQNVLYVILTLDAWEKEYVLCNWYYNQHAAMFAAMLSAMLATSLLPCMVLCLCYHACQFLPFLFPSTCQALGIGPNADTLVQGNFPGKLITDSQIIHGWCSVCSVYVTQFHSVYDNENQRASAKELIACFFIDDSYNISYVLYSIIPTMHHIGLNFVEFTNDNYFIQDNMLALERSKDTFKHICDIGQKQHLNIMPLCMLHWVHILHSRYATYL